MRLAGTIIWAAASLYLLVLLVRVVLDVTMAFSRGWRPKGWLAAMAEVVYVVTDPPIKLVRRLIPPLRLGAVALDLGFIVVMLTVSALAYLGQAMLAG